MLSCLRITLLFLFISFSVYGKEAVEIYIKGVSGEAANNVKLALALPYGIVSDGKIDKLLLERFVKQADKKILNSLKPFGYYDPKISVRLENRTEEEYLLRVEINKGDPVRISNLNISIEGPGEKEEQLLKAVSGFPLQINDTLLQPEYEEAKDVLKNKALELGYLNASFSIHEIIITKATSLAVIKLVLDTGLRYYFGVADFEGVSEYRDGFLKRFLTFKEGDPFSYDKLGETKLNLANSERFKEINILPRQELLMDKKIPVSVKMKQSPSKSLRPGIGFGTDTGFRFTINYRDMKLFDVEHDFRLSLYGSAVLQGLLAVYSVPGLKDVLSLTSFQFNLQHELNPIYTSRLMSFKAEQDRSFKRGEFGMAYIKFQFEEYSIGLENSSSQLIMPGLRFTKETYDNKTRPVNGFNYTLELRGTDRALGSNTGFFQFMLGGNYLLPLPLQLSLRSRVRLDATLYNETISALPPSVRFFAGGDQSVRGYAYQSLGPLDSSGNVVGGQHLFTLNLELERDLFKDFAVSIFFDAGNAFDAFNEAGLFKSAGIGLHYYTLVGALNLSLARQIDVINPSYLLHFTVGFDI